MNSVVFSVTVICDDDISLIHKKHAYKFMTACEEDDGDADDDQEKVEEEWEEDDKDV